MDRSRAIWRAMTPDDISEVVVVAAAAHPRFYEKPAVFLERLHLFPRGAWLLERDERAMGYALSHPWGDEELPSLNSLLGSLPEKATTYYVHDLALLPAVRRTPAAAELLGLLTTLAYSLGYPSMTLVAVNGSSRFWEKHGFGIVKRPDVAAKLSTYDASAVMMEKTLV